MIFNVDMEVIINDKEENAESWKKIIETFINRSLGDTPMNPILEYHFGGTNIKSINLKKE